MNHSRFRIWEWGVILSGGLLALSSGWIYLNDPTWLSFILGLEQGKGGTPVGTLELEQGTVRRRLSSESGFTRLERYSSVYNSDLIVTGNDSNAQIRLSEGGSLEIGAHSMVRLSFDSQQAVDGVSWQMPTVEVISGQVRATASQAQKLIVKSRDQVVTLSPKASYRALAPASPKRPEESLTPKTVVINAEAPAPPLEEQPPVAVQKKPPLPPKPETKITALLQPALHQVFKLPDFPKELELSIAFRWTMTPEDGQAILKIWKWPEKKLVHEEKITASKGIASLKKKFIAPGDYLWQVEGTEGHFRIDPLFLGIKGSPELQREYSNHYSGLKPKQLSMHLKWEPYPSAKKYKLVLTSESPNPTSSAPLLAIETTEHQYDLHDLGALSGKYSYSIISELSHGFRVTSKKEEFSFNFAAPRLVFPRDKNRIQQSAYTPAKPNQILIWERTDFTKSYEIKISFHSDGLSQDLIRSTESNFYILPHPKPGTYGWRVRSVGQGSVSPFSESRSFTVLPTQ